MADFAYRPEVFNPKSLEEARRIILTPEPTVSTDERWETETPYLADALASHLGLRDGDLVLDYGCGIGRLSRALIADAGCALLGVDISASMRAYAQVYVESQRFAATSPEGLQRLTTCGLQVDHAYAVWVLQHCLDPAAEIARVAAALAPGGYFCVVNSTERWVPTNQGWRSDGKDVLALLRTAFKDIDEISLADAPISAALRTSSFFRIFRKPWGASARR